MIIETIFSTLDESGNPNFAPMGLVWGEEFVTVRPFRKSHTCHNLLSSGYGVASLTDNVLAYVQCGLYDMVLPHFPAQSVPGFVFRGACSWIEMAMVAQGGNPDRAEVHCRVTHRGRLRDFLGFCRAGGAVIEAAILATRAGLYDEKIVADKMTCYGEIVEKTGSRAEKEAFQLVWEYIKKGCAGSG